MKPAPFAYDSPHDLTEALRLLDRYGASARVLAGGQSLVPLLAAREETPDRLIDVNRITALEEIRVEGDRLVIGALARQACIGRDPLVRTHAPLLAQATRLIGSFPVRNRGTLGGSLAQAEPAAEYPAAALALDTEVDVVSVAGERRLPIAALIEGPYATSLQPHELIVRVRVPLAGVRTGFAIDEIARRHGDLALAGCAAALQVGDDRERIEAARVVVFGVGPRAARLTSVERQLLDVGAEPAALARCLAESVGRFDAVDDVMAGADYRRAVLEPLAIDVTMRALERARGPETAR